MKIKRTFAYKLFDTQIKMMYSNTKDENIIYMLKKWIKKSSNAWD